MFFVLKRQYFYNLAFTIALIFAFGAFLSKSPASVPTSALPVTGKIIVIDAGHGTPDGGAVGISGILEKDVNLSVAKELGNLLQQGGATIIYTRENDFAVADSLNKRIRNIKREDLKNRKKIKSDSGADLFISIHMNKFEDPKYSGAQVFYQSKSDSSKALAEITQKYLHDFADKTNTREAKDSKNTIFILNDSQIPSVLVECGFLSNPTEEKKLLDTDYQKKLAYAIYSGITQYITNT